MSEQYRIEVEVSAFFIEEQSDIAHDQYAFGYQVRIRNLGNIGATLISRHWLISDAHGALQEVRGQGVIGEQPHLAPGQVFEYSSWAQLTTPWGQMRGSYQMQADDGQRFDADIPEFHLVLPRMLH
ncbi:Co2+/Mg2+ efflux protein ApaG [Aquitalea sp. S1-19]|uniref:Protein ApaG n=2 Tax=Craterilacuibacter sinensis TaxID=2686017 RepID=A0A845BN53_9NEIS|nr:Co2+/Mg2+ efflux protein ApaG [Aquitalea sp. S1-19]MXR37785.1 Co2+/Mg2+ efflux protein ApaG [Craterilacuibacter sinensis]RQW25331.1 Co2+/Mg2+ efflux protein ApaG [Rhodobacteraceae bacterium CH30]